MNRFTFTSSGGVRANFSAASDPGFVESLLQAFGLSHKIITMNRAHSKAYLFFVFCLSAILVSLFVIAEDTSAPVTTDAVTIARTEGDAAPTLAPVQSCHATSWDEVVREYKNCTITTPLTTCSDAPLNKTCTTIDVTRQGLCDNGTRTVSRERTECTATGYRATSGVVLDTTGYACTVSGNGKAYVTCDSIYDGNGDGVCTSGESCVQFGIVGGFVTRQERNSDDRWADHDATYTLNRAAVLA